MHIWYVEVPAQNIVVGSDGTRHLAFVKDGRGSYKLIVETFTRSRTGLGVCGEWLRLKLLKHN